MKERCKTTVNSGWITSIPITKSCNTILFQRCLRIRIPICYHTLSGSNSNKHRILPLEFDMSPFFYISRAYFLVILIQHSQLLFFINAGSYSLSHSVASLTAMEEPTGALDSAEVRECRKRREILERNLRG